MLKRFLLVWITYWLLYFIQPVSSIYPNIIEAFFLQIFFVCVVALAYVCTAFSVLTDLNLRVMTSISSNYNDYKKKIIIVGYILSTVGLVFLLYDKVFVQEIDYSQGFAAAREQWRQIGENRDGSASSLYSMFGYLLGSGYFFSLALLFSKDTNISDAIRIFGIFFGVFLLLLNSVLTGGRSSVLLAAAFVAYASQLKFNTDAFTLFKSRFAKLLVIIVVLGLVFYVIYIFSLRSIASQMDFSSYGLSFLEFLGLRPNAWFSAFVQESEFGGIFALINLAISYLTHSLSTTAAIIDYSGHGSIIVFNYMYTLLTKVGLMDMPDTFWFLEGRFSSLPGAIYFQFGLPGVAIAALVLGTVSSIFNLLYKYKIHSVAFLLACCAMESVLLLSPFVFAGDFLSFPFVISGAVFSMFFAKMRRVRFNASLSND